MITNVEIIFIEKKSLCSNFFKFFTTSALLRFINPFIKIILGHDGEKKMQASVTLHGQ